MNAEVISVGAELLSGETVDTNAPEICRELAGCGIPCEHRQTVGDNLEAIASAVRLALSRSRIVVTIGGLGPTQDDLTRDGIASALGLPLEEDPEMLDTIRTVFADRGFRWVESNRLQAKKPRAAEFLRNPNGTAPGLWILHGDGVVLALPGPPREFTPMLQVEALRKLRDFAGVRNLVSRTVRICGLGESRVAELVDDLITGSPPSVAPYAKVGDVHLRITSSAPTLEAAWAEIAPVEEEIRRRLGWHVYGVDDCSLAQAILQRLADEGAKLAIAESCTGGLVASILTDAPGASKCFVGGAVTYVNSEKVRQLSVKSELIERVGPVSEEVAMAMAIGAKKAFGSDYALSVTGVAGPGSDERGIPEGTVYLGLCSPSGEYVQKSEMGKGRLTIKHRAAMSSLTLLWKHLVQGGLP